ncbi:hypothetical protein [Rhizobium sp. Rhizsp82]|uniref:hypothetical protein n=1 Tax=Rhizobium sp. Rhizsp82 TaxID=3243057 RepID=UPI0039B3F486
MADLLETAIEAHGGLDRWEKAKKLSVRYTATGITDLKGWKGAFLDVTVVIDPHRPLAEISPFIEPDQTALFEPSRTAIIRRSTGDIITERFEPRQAFEGHSLNTPWDPQHLAYFAGYALWTYLTTPFLFNLPGFEATEVEPWIEDGEEWRRLRVVFPPEVASHSREQVFYFDKSGLLKRHDYSADVLGGTSSANYALAPKSFGGLIIPTKRRVYAKDSNNRPLLDRVAVAINIHDVVTA